MSRSHWVMALAVAGMMGGIYGKSSWGQAQPAFPPVFVDPFVPFDEVAPNRIMIGRSEAALQLVNPAADEPLPGDAAKIMEATNGDIAAIQQNADAEIAVIQRKADEEMRLRREKAIAALQELQDKYTRDARLDEAVAIRNRIRRLKLADIDVFRDPGSLYALQYQIGKSFHFEVVGTVNGTLWGTEVYTGDSTLAKAAVHSGVLKPGQKGIVRVTVLEGQQEYEGSTQYDVTSAGYGPYSFSFTVAPWRDTPVKPE